jgi:hypothetical protein
MIIERGHSPRSTVQGPPRPLNDRSELSVESAPQTRRLPNSNRTHKFQLPHPLGFWSALGPGGMSRETCVPRVAVLNSVLSRMRVVKIFILDSHGSLFCLFVANC